MPECVTNVRNAFRFLGNLIHVRRATSMSSHFSRRRFVAGVGLATAGLCSGGARAVAASSDDLDAFIRARMELAHVPGLSLAIVRDGKLVRAAGFGYADLAHQRPMRADTLINIASVTKTATCTA